MIARIDPSPIPSILQPPIIQSMLMRLSLRRVSGARRVDREAEKSMALVCHANSTLGLSPTKERKVPQTFL
jgi:hypothetical protein